MNSRCAALLLALVAYPTCAADPADAIYYWGDVVTIDDKNPTAEAVAVAKGKIVAVGKRDDVLKLKGEKTTLVDLKGKTLLAGFVDGHGHGFGTGLPAASANLLAPPDHIIRDIPGLVAELKKIAETDTAKKSGIILGFGYDDAQLKEQWHPTRHDLDEASKVVPVYCIHQSGHLGAGNTKALEVAGLPAETKNACSVTTGATGTAIPC
jgi:predicted amidohydrolase YtcJ